VTLTLDKRHGDRDRLHRQAPSGATIKGRQAATTLTLDNVTVTSGAITDNGTVKVDSGHHA